MASPSYLIYLWPGRGLVRCSNIVGPPHRHEAIQVTIALDRPFKIKGKGGAWKSSTACIMDSGFVHEINGEGAAQAILYVEAESALGMGLRGLYLRQGPLAQLEKENLKEAMPLLRALPTDCQSAKRIWDGALRALAGPELVERQPDLRVRRALEIFKGLPEKKISARELAQRVGLSESRLSHLFQQDLGLSIRRTLLWLKVLEAARFVSGKGSATEAAHAAGFTDSAHLARTYRSLMGISPGMLFRNRSFVEVRVCG